MTDKQANIELSEIRKIIKGSKELQALLDKVGSATYHREMATVENDRNDWNKTLEKALGNASLAIIDAVHDEGYFTTPNAIRPLLTEIMDSHMNIAEKVQKQIRESEAQGDGIGGGNVPNIHTSPKAGRPR